MLGGGVEQDADVAAGVGDLGVRPAEDGGVSGRRRGQPDHHAHRGGLASPVRAEEAGDRPGLDAERHVVDGGERAVPSL